MRHPIAAELRHAEIQRAAVGFAGFDDASFGQAEIAARGTDDDRVHVGNGYRELQAQVDGPAASEAMAMPAIGMQIRTCSGLERLAGIRRVGQSRLSDHRLLTKRRKGFPVVGGPADDSQLGQGYELVAAIASRSRSFTTRSAPGILKPTWRGVSQARFLRRSSSPQVGCQVVGAQPGGRPRKTWRAL